MSDHSSDFGPTASWENLRRRAALLNRLRQFFQEHDFLEVDTPLLSRDSVVDRHLDPLWVTLSGEQAVGGVLRLWLQTSPEFCLKRLLAAGGQAIFQVAHAVRGGERGPLHNLEFTLVEWYRAGDTMHDGIDLLDKLTQTMLGRGPARRVSYAQAFQQSVGLDPHGCTLARLQQAAGELGFVPPDSWDHGDRDAWLDWLLVTRVEPTLGGPAPVIVYDYPASQAALARVRPHPVPVAERFELYVDGIELANGYHELLDPAALQYRARQANESRQADGKDALPEASRLLDAMRHGLPPCTGVALGFDRLVMVALGAQQLSEVMAFPVERA
jgi:lysyl-tRNA synthetase class 2